MPIKFSCAKCQKSFTVADTSAGKQGRCSDCGHLNTIPSTVAEAPAASATYEVTSSVNGAVFGPADKKTLAQWVQEARITPDCQIKRVGSENWKPAKQLFPSLANASATDAAQAPQSAEVLETPAADPFAKFTSGNEGGEVLAGSASTAANPYAASSTMKKQFSVSGEVVPTVGDVGFIISHAFEAYKKQMGVMIGAFFVYFILAMFNSILVQMFPAMLGVVGLVIGMILNIFISAFLMAGLINISLKVGRGEPAALGDLFAVGDRVLPLVGFALLSSIVFLVPIIIMGIVLPLVGQGGEVIGLILAAMVFLVMLVFGLLFWSGYFLVADRKTSVFQAYSVGIEIGKKNILSFIAIYFIAALVGMAGFILLGIGIFLTCPLAVLIVSCAYLNMSGQIGK